MNFPENHQVRRILFVAKNPGFSPSFPHKLLESDTGNKRLIPRLYVRTVCVFPMGAGWGYADITGTAGHKLHQLHHTQQLTTLEIPQQFLGLSMKILQHLTREIHHNSRANAHCHCRCHWKVSLKNVFKKCLWKVSLKGVFEKCLWKWSLKMCLWKSSLKSVFKMCLWKVYLKRTFEKCL